MMSTTIASYTEKAPEARAASSLSGRRYAGSELGVVRRVILHCPGLELRRLTATNKDELLFDDVLWVKRARQEQDAFADSLRDRSVEVLYLLDLLADPLALSQARETVLARAIGQNRGSGDR